MFKNLARGFRQCHVGIREDHMQFMEERILKDGQVRAGNILKVDNFLNHQVDVDFLSEMGKAF